MLYLKVYTPGQLISVCPCLGVGGRCSLNKLLNLGLQVPQKNRAQRNFLSMAIGGLKQLIRLSR